MLFDAVCHVINGASSFKRLRNRTLHSKWQITNTLNVWFWRFHIWKREKRREKNTRRASSLQQVGLGSWKNLDIFNQFSRWSESVDSVRIYVASALMNCIVTLNLISLCRKHRKFTSNKSGKEMAETPQTLATVCHCKCANNAHDLYGMLHCNIVYWMWIWASSQTDGNEHRNARALTNANVTHVDAL